MNAGPPLALCLCGLLAPVPVLAAACEVPGPQHATIQQAADDPACSSIVLSAGSYPASTRLRRSLDLLGAGSGATVVEGRIEVVDGATVALAGFAIANGCPEPGLSVSGGAAVSAEDLLLEPALLPCPALSYPVFKDGFEP